MDVKQQIKQDEGLRLKPYKCTAGKLTIGYGYNLENGIPEHFADMMLDYSISVATKEAIGLTVNYNLPMNWTMKNILIQMCFQLGGQGVRGFKKMLAALERSDFKTAAKEMLDSDWHKQTPERCERLAAEMSSLK
jgi:lysozyme